MYGCPIRTRSSRTGGEKQSPTPDGRDGRCPNPDNNTKTYNPVYDSSTVPSRLKRYQTQGSYHFLTFSCHRRLPYLNNDPPRTTFLEQLEKLRSNHSFYVFGYVLMPEHVHLLLSEPKIHSLATTLNVLKHETSQRLKDDRSQFWQRRYYDFNVLTQAKVTEKLRYIHRNPVTRGLVEKPEDRPWSSYRHWLTGERSPIEIESHWTLAERERCQKLPAQA
jgi:putative transposase